MDHYENKDLISVIIPVYNVEDYLERCIDSVLAQTYDNIEVILVDDGSTDGSSEICDSYAEEDSRVRVLHQENGKQAAARNAGLAEATGEYITFSDSDDVMHPDKIRMMYENALETDADVVICPFDYVDEELKILPWGNTRYTGDSPVSSLEARRVFLTTHSIEGIFWNKLIRRDLLTESGIVFDVSKEIYDEVVPAYRLFQEAETVSFVREPLHSYVQHEDNNTYSPDSGQLALYIETLKEIKALAEEDKLPQEAAYYYDSRVIQAAHLAYKRRNLYSESDYEDVAKLFAWDRVFGAQAPHRIKSDSTYFTEGTFNRLKTRVKLILNRKHYG